MSAKYLSPAQVALEYKVKPLTVTRWITRGVTVNGQHIRLQALRVGRSWKTLKPWVDHFIAQCNPDRPPSIETPTQRERRINADMDALQKELAL